MDQAATQWIFSQCRDGLAGLSIEYYPLDQSDTQWILNGYSLSVGMDLPH